MRTTIDIDAEILAAVRSLASGRRRSMGKVVSDLLRRALAPRAAGRRRNGVPLFRPRRGAPPVTPEIVNEIRDAIDG
jgi:hypothetical protein